MFKRDKIYKFKDKDSMLEFIDRHGVNSHVVKFIKLGTEFKVLSVRDTSVRLVEIDGKQYDSMEMGIPTFCADIITAYEFGFFVEVEQEVDDYAVLVLLPSGPNDWREQAKNQTKEQADVFARDWLTRRPADSLIIVRGVSRMSAIIESKFVTKDF